MSYQSFWSSTFLYFFLSLSISLMLHPTSNAQSYTSFVKVWEKEYPNARLSTYFRTILLLYMEQFIENEHPLQHSFIVFFSDKSTEYSFIIARNRVLCCFLFFAYVYLVCSQFFIWMLTAKFDDSLFYLCWSLAIFFAKTVYLEYFFFFIC